jgi:hypothetical protein
MSKQIEAQFLSKGAVLRTGQVVTHAPYVDSKTPSGKIHIGVNGFKKTWNKKTLIATV